MSRFRSFVLLLPEMFRTLFRGRITVRFPFGAPVLPAYFRGKVVIDAALCKGCGLCVRDCPAFALELEHDEAGGFKLIHYRDRCAYCGQCQEVCGQGAIRLIDEYVTGTADREALRETFQGHC